MTSKRFFGHISAAILGISAPIFGLGMASSAAAETLNIVTSIAPAQGLAIEIAGARHAPELLVPAGGDPHDFVLRPSQVRTLQNADIIVLMGNGMEPWWDSVAGQIDAATMVINLGELPEVAQHLLAMRDVSGQVDPHIWLDPAILEIAGTALAESFAARNEDGRADYLANRDAMAAALTEATGEITASMHALHDVELVMGHDSLQYFEHAFDLQFGGALTDGHGHEAGAHSVGEIGHIDGEACLVVDINESDDHGHTLLEGAPIVRVDPLGSGLLGETHFAASLLRNLADGLKDCAHHH